MTTSTLYRVRPGRVGLYLLVGSLFLGGTGRGQAQTPPLLPPAPPMQPDLQETPIVPPSQLFSCFGQGGSANGQPNRIRLFRIQPGFLSDPVGLDSDDKTLADPVSFDPDPGPDWLNITAGNDNPYFDFRRRTDPGGVGYTRVNTQMQLLDTTRTACSVGLEAVTPAGLQCDGIADKMGTTVVTPAVSLFHMLDDETAFQAYVGVHMPLMNSATQQVSRDVQCGVAVQRALTSAPTDPFRNVYLSVGAVGQLKTSDSSNLQKPMAVDMLPGLHYKMADNWWISGAVVLPVAGAATTTTERQQWQVTCSFQF